ncbi:glycosyltransferase family A protein [Microbacterium sp. G2-8]|uniref:glycosyltransferase family 2 protein n=1 Tax=Microbacterium sp. G2-8 TaxID=2842454 RepID=UPI001C89FE59|nr:glycosyltransferase family A protein [Microbacterium sp. G2-8]
MPRLSVLLPAFDAAGTIDLAVRSTLRALPRDAELVVADDGSRDGTADVLAAIDDRRLRVISGPNRGVARTLNGLLEATDSEFIARMDADDVTLPGRFRHQLRALQSADVVFSSVAAWTGRGAPRPSFSPPIGSAAFPFHLLLTNPVAHSTMAARRASLAACDGYRVVPSEDYDLWLRLAHRGTSMRRLAAPAVLYRTHDDQVTAADAWRRRSWQDPETQEAFERLSVRLLGRPHTRITTLAVAPLPRAEAFERFAAFERDVRAAVSPLPFPARRRLIGVLDRRCAWLWERILSSPPTLPFDSATALAGPAR